MAINNWKKMIKRKYKHITRVDAKLNNQGVKPPTVHSRDRCASFKKSDLKKNTKNILKYFIEFLIVAFGVFLGIYASEWQNQKKSNKTEEKAIANIIRELEQNKNSLQNSIEYHKLIKLSLDSVLKTFPRETYFEPYFKNQKNFKFKNINGWKGNGFSEFENTAFEVTKMSGTLQNMDIDLIQDISKVYNKIKVMTDFQKVINGRMANLNSESKTIDVIGDISIISGDNLNMEKSLLKELEQAIDGIKTTHKNVYKKQANQS